jgi:hypothetical protein
VGYRQLRTVVGPKANLPGGLLALWTNIEIGYVKISDMMAVIPECSDISKIRYHERSAYWLAITAAPPDLPMADPNVSQKDRTLFEQSPMEATELHESSGTVVHLRMTNLADKKWR